jgi:hypothetical protein
VIEGAERIRRKAERGGDGTPLLEELVGTEREFRAERRRDYLRSPLRTEALRGHVLREVTPLLLQGAK